MPTMYKIGEMLPNKGGKYDTFIYTFKDLTNPFGGAGEGSKRYMHSRV